MELSPRTIVSKAISLILIVVVALYGIGFVKKIQRRAAVISELSGLASTSSYFNQFYADDARKTLIRAIGLVAEAKSLGLEPDNAIRHALKLEKGLFDERDPITDADPKTLIAFDSIHDNYFNALKLGYDHGFQTIASMKSGELPPIPHGPQTGRRAEIVPIIDPALSPGLEKVVANLSIRPPGQAPTSHSDVETAAAKQLTERFAAAGLIEDSVKDRILKALSQPSKGGKR